MNKPLVYGCLGILLLASIPALAEQPPLESEAVGEASSEAQIAPAATPEAFRWFVFAEAVIAERFGSPRFGADACRRYAPWLDGMSDTDAGTAGVSWVRWRCAETAGATDEAERWRQTTASAMANQRISDHLSPGVARFAAGSMLDVNAIIDSMGLRALATHLRLSHAGQRLTQNVLVGGDRERLQELQFDLTAMAERLALLMAARDDDESSAAFYLQHPGTLLLASLQQTRGEAHDILVAEALDILARPGSGRHQDAEALLLRAAEAGSADAAYFLGKRMAVTDIDARRDEGQRHLEAAMNAGHGPAALALVALCEAGRLVCDDEASMAAIHTWLAQSYSPAEAAHRRAALHAEGDMLPDAQQRVRWLRQASEAGRTRAMLEFGLELLDNATAESRGDEGLAWIRKAAEAGDAQAIGHLVYELRRIDGVTDEVMQWMERGAEYGDAYSLYQYGLHLVDSKQGAADLERAASMYRRSAEAGMALGQYFHGRALDRGEGVAADPAAAARWFARAAAQGDQTSAAYLAEMYETGRGVTRDPARAVEMYRVAAEAGNIWAMTQLGRLLWNVDPPLQDLAQAEQWLVRAGKAGEAYAWAFLGMRYEFGDGVERDHARAFDYYRRCEESDSGHCLWLLGEALLQGIGTAVDRTRGIEVLERAVALGSKNARCTLGVALMQSAPMQGGADSEAAQRGVALASAAGEEGAVTCQEQMAMHELRNENEPAAIPWLERAAAEGSSFAQVNLVALRLQPDASAYAPEIGLRDGEACAATDARCAMILVRHYLWWSDPPDPEAARRWTLHAYQLGDYEATVDLALSEYYRDAPDDEQARVYLEALVDRDPDFAPLLARIDWHAGRHFEARQRLLLLDPGSVPLAAYLLSRWCAPPSDCPEPSMSLGDRVEHWQAEGNEGLANRVAWELAVDPRSDEADGAFAVELIRGIAAGHEEPWIRDTLAAALARAGHFDEACRIQTEVAVVVHGDIDATQRALFEERRAAFCDGKAWNSVE